MSDGTPGHLETGLVVGVDVASSDDDQGIDPAVEDPDFAVELLRSPIFAGFRGNFRVYLR